MKKFLCLLIGIVLVPFIPLKAMGEAPCKIGIVDLQQCLSESIEGKKLLEELKAKLKGLQNKLDAEKNELMKLQEELGNQSMMLSMDAKEDRGREFDRKRREYEYLYKDLGNEMKKAEIDVQKKMLKDLAKVVDKIGSDLKYTIILEKRSGGIMFFDKTIDITNEIIKLYDATKK